MAGAWVQDSYPHYRLVLETVKSFLKETFPDADERYFNVRFTFDDYIFEIPRQLTESERNALGAKRLEVPDYEGTG